MAVVNNCSTGNCASTVPSLLLLHSILFLDTVKVRLLFFVNRYASSECFGDGSGWRLFHEILWFNRAYYCYIQLSILGLFLNFKGRKNSWILVFSLDKDDLNQHSFWLPLDAIVVTGYFLLTTIIANNTTNAGVQHGWLSSSGGWDVPDAPYGGSQSIAGRGVVAVGDGLSAGVLDLLFC